MKKLAVLCLAALVLALTMVPGTSRAYLAETTDWGDPLWWRSSQMAYFINGRGGPLGCYLAIRRAANAWTNVGSSSFRFIYVGQTGATAFRGSDGLNVVSFGRMYSPDTLALTNTWYDTGTGEILESDTRFNLDYRYSTTVARGTYDVQNVGAHELGHALGLADLYGAADAEKTMYGYCSRRETKKRTLHPDDVWGVSDLYPNWGGGIVGGISGR